jgi:hypothetical protein
MMTWHNIATAGAYTACMIRACRGHALSASYLFRSNILYCWWYVWFTMWRLASNLTKKTWMVGIQILSSHSQAARKGAGVPSVRTKTTDNSGDVLFLCVIWAGKRRLWSLYVSLFSSLDLLSWGTTEAGPLSCVRWGRIKKKIDFFIQNPA